jgi:hypothetical protein
MATPINLTSWNFNLSTVDSAYSDVTDISTLNYHGIAYVEATGVNTFEIEGLGTIDSYTSHGVHSLTESGYQLTVKYIAQVTGSLSGNTLTYTHTGGYLQIFIDDIAGGGTLAGSTESTFTDGGNQIASFTMTADGLIPNYIYLDTLDGSDRANFLLNSPGIAGLFTSSLTGTADLGDYMLFALATSQLSSTPDTLSGLELQLNGVSGPVFFVQEDGNIRASAVVPEPSTFILIGMGFLGLGAYYRKRNS